MFVDFHPQSLTGDWMRRTITFGNVIIALSRDTWLKNINECQVLFSNWNIFRAEMTLYFRSSAWCTLKYGELVYILLELTWTWLAARRLHWIFGYEHCVVLLFWDKLYCRVFQTFGWHHASSTEPHFVFIWLILLDLSWIHGHERLPLYRTLHLKMSPEPRSTMWQQQQQQQDWKKIYKVGVVNRWISILGEISL